MAAEDGRRGEMALTEDLFFAALALPPQERGHFLDVRCSGDRALRSEVESLLAAEAEGRQFLERPLALPGEAGLIAAQALVGRQVGDFTIEGVLGEGGMGVVFRAEQGQPRRTVALKLVRPGLATSSMLRRFELEAEALGRLRHPGIAAIHAAGTADLGMGPQPYLAMELVEGRSLREHLVGGGHPGLRSLEARVRLVIAISEAVQHAHQNGVIHRDLKPDNILVEDGLHGEARPRILDFGVARLLEAGPGHGPRTSATEAGDVVGTLQYMSPEQVGSGSVDTRSDVYALGLIAWEAIALRPARNLGSEGVAQAIRAVAEQDPPLLQTTVPDVPTDLAIVIGKAIEREPGRRYATAGEFAADLERFLRHEPVTAQAPTRRYLLRRFVRRNRTLVGSAAAVALTLVAGLVATLALLIRTGQALKAEHARAIESTAVADYIFWTLRLDPNRPGDGPLDPAAVKGLLKQLDEGIEQRLADKPQAQVRILNLIGERLVILTEYAAARATFERALAICESALPRRHELRAAALHGVASAEWFLGQSDPAMLAGARSHYEEALSIRTERLGVDNSETALTMRHLAATLRSLKDDTPAERLYRDSLAIHERLHGAGDPAADLTMVASGLNGLASFVASKQEWPEAAELYRRALSAMRSMPDVERRVVDEARVLRNVGVARGKLRDFEAAGHDLEEAEGIFRQQLGNSHREVATTLLRRATLAAERGDMAMARALARQVLDGFGLPASDALVREARRIIDG